MDNTSTQDDTKTSVCDVLKSDTSEIIQKLESQSPSLFQNYSNLYAEYLHMFNDLFGTCYIAEKEFFDKLNIDPKLLTQIKKNSELTKKNYLEFIEMNTKYWDEYFKMRVSAVKSFDSFMHVLIDSYAKTLSQINKSKESQK
ncbi:hypothetical protein [Nitrosopumilus sp. S6]